MTFQKYIHDAKHKRTKAKSVCVCINVSVCMGVYEARVLYWKGFSLDAVMLTSSGLHGSLFPSSLPKAPGCLCMTSSPKHAPLNPLRISPSSLQLRLAALQPIRFFSLLLFSSPPSSLSHPPLLWQFPPLFLNQEKALSWARAWSKKRSPPKPLPFCKFNKPTLKICLINGWHLWLEQRRGILLGLGHCWPPN